VRPRVNFLGLFLAHRRELLSYATQIVGDHTRAEDVVQDAYLRLAGMTAGKFIDAPIGYLYRIVRNLAIDGRRREQRDARYFVAGTDKADKIAADHPSPEAAAADREDMRRLAAALAELPERTRIALEMHRLGGCTLQTIAAHLGISIGLAHALVIDGIEHCRTRLCRPDKAP
jgi:RNA polymerase sigma factor (sigma-70 family)